MNDARASHFEERRLVGWMRFDCFAQTRAEGERIIEAGDSSVELDLGGLEHANSLAVSAMIAWYRCAFRQGKIVHFSNVPPELRKIIDISGLVELLLND